MRRNLSHDRERFPGLREQLGEDPARWLDAEILGIGSKHVDGRSRMVRDRIESLDRIEVVRAWKAVERRLDRGDDGGPRSGIIEALDEREADLDEIGERPNRLEGRDEPRDLPPVETIWPMQVSMSHRATVADRSSRMRTSALRWITPDRIR
ncbi:hypothetical protein SAMN05216559_2328 [Halomicrobium zhouii]|uniref:Uncharacterized protein n=1 Tax=Halomicrobium zhouii TaxID=767519 RepID=A0A1I6L9S4_9EURY|nr:hypothetical protein [Halomicrobium zhouii]SFS00219.1 hypothetical protein SAMN05216559_2328 [Halomicrobium zhouii]